MGERRAPMGLNHGRPARGEDANEEKLDGEHDHHVDEHAPHQMPRIVGGVWKRVARPVVPLTGSSA